MIRWHLIITLSLIQSGLLDDANAESFNKYGVYVYFLGDYVKAGDIGNESIKVDGVVAETYSSQSKYGLYTLTFLRFSSIPKGTLEQGMQGAVHSVRGKLKDYRYLKINGYTVLEYEYSTHKFGPILHYVERSFLIDKKILVNVKYVGLESGISSGNNFLSSLKIE